jgi:hypothetical protein
METGGIPWNRSCAPIDSHINLLNKVEARNEWNPLSARSPNNDKCASNAESEFTASGPASGGNGILRRDAGSGLSLLDILENQMEIKHSTHL